MNQFHKENTHMDGVLLVNKPPEITSYKVVEKIKKHFEEYEEKKLLDQGEDR